MALTVSPDGRWLATRIGWDLRRGKPGKGEPAVRLEGLSGQTPVAFSPDGRWLGAVQEDGRVALWRMPP
ncbi:hypothetical protein [Thermoflexus hugenholtzii]